MSPARGGGDEPPPKRDAGTPDGGTVSGLRPYLLTAGRAEPVDHTLEIEAQVLTTEIGARCQTTISVAEVAARLRLHIGVARVLVADLAALGYLLVQRPNPPLAHDRNLIERVIRGLEAIR